MTVIEDDDDDAPRPPKVKKPPPPPEPGSEIFTGWIETVEAFRRPLTSLGVEILSEQEVSKDRVRFNVKLREEVLERIKFLWCADLHWHLENTGYYKKERR